MRDLALVMATLVMMAPAVVMPHIGVLVWSWIALMQPHREAFGFSTQLPINFAVAAGTVLFWIFSREPKRLPMTAMTIVLIAFAFWMLVSAASGFSWDRSYRLLDRNLKTLLLAFIVMGVMVDRKRIHALVWVIAASLAYFAVKGAGFTLLTGGGYNVMGPVGTHIADRNHLALALCMCMPLLYYLRVYAVDRWIRLGLLAALAGTIVAVLGTQSRGGLIALAAMLGVFWWRSKQKVFSFMLLAAVGSASLAFMPESYYQRMETITGAVGGTVREDGVVEDASFRGRLEAWEMAVNLANDRPLTGAGFEGYMDPNIFFRYNPNAGKARAIHSIYFQVLADMGYVGLFLFLGLAALALRYCFYVIATARRHPELRWAGDLASMFIPSFAGFFVAGAALSMPYYDLYYVMLAILCRLKVLADEVRAQAQQPAPAVMALRRSA